MDKLENIFKLYKEFGKYDYIGEKISQVEHMIQAAMLAEKDNQTNDIILACFLHDIGHLIGLENKLESDDFGVIDHEYVGAEYLKEIGFKYPIPDLIVNHVKAKKYLTSKYPEYYEKLSEASKNTLIKQGGPMNIEESIRFENDPLFEISLKMRQYDEQAKIENMKLKELEYYFDLIKNYFGYS